MDDGILKDLGNGVFIHDGVFRTPLPERKICNNDYFNLSEMLNHLCEVLDRIDSRLQFIENTVKNSGSKSNYPQFPEGPDKPGFPVRYSYPFSEGPNDYPPGPSII